MLQRGAALAVIVALSLVLAACGGSAEEERSKEASAAPAAAQAAAAPQPEPTPAEDAPGDAVSGDSADLPGQLREKTMQLWDVYNTYDLDALKVFYEENYWKEREEQTRLDMQPFESRGLTFTAEETSPPTEIAPGKWETKHTARFDGGEHGVCLRTIQGRLAAHLRKARVGSRRRSSSPVTDRARGFRSLRRLL